MGSPGALGLMECDGSRVGCGSISQVTNRTSRGIGHVEAGFGTSFGVGTRRRLELYRETGSAGIRVLVRNWVRLEAWAHRRRSGRGARRLKRGAAGSHSALPAAKLVPAPVKPGPAAPSPSGGTPLSIPQPTPPQPAKK
jgi:hypothetical protein